MRIAVVGIFGRPGDPATGPRRVSTALARALRSRGADLDLYEIVMPRGRLRRFIERGAETCELPHLPPIVRLTPRQSLDIGRRGYDVVHFLGSLGTSSLPLLWQLHRCRTPTVATLNGLYCLERRYGFPYTVLDDLAEAIGLRLVRWPVAVSAPFASLVGREYPFLGDRIRVIGHGFDHVLPAGEAVLRKEDAFLSLGGTYRVKGIPFLLAGFRRLSPAGVSARLYLGGPAGDQEQEIEALLGRLGEHVTRLGVLPPERLSTRYSTCAGYVQTSFYETFGLTILEAMAHAAPVVVTDACGVSSLIEDGRSGFVVPFGDVPGLAERLTALATSPELRRELGAHGQTIARSMTWAAAASKYEQIYRAATSGTDRMAP